MYSPVPIHGYSLILIADAHNSSASLCLADDTHEAVEVKVLVLAAQADAGHLHCEVLLRDDRHVALAAHFIRHAVDIVALQVPVQLGARVGERIAQSLFDAVASGFNLCP
jgi:hypothetical protein